MIDAQRSHSRAAHIALDSIYGLGADAAGFTGLADAATINALGQPQVVNVAGASAELTSVYLVRTGDADAALIAGMDGEETVAAGMAVPMAASQTTHPHWRRRGLRAGRSAGVS